MKKQLTTPLPYIETPRVNLIKAPTRIDEVLEQRMKAFLRSRRKQKRVKRRVA